MFLDLAIQKHEYARKSRNLALTIGEDTSFSSAGVPQGGLELRLRFCPCALNPIKIGVSAPHVKEMLKKFTWYEHVKEMLKKCVSLTCL